MPTLEPEIEVVVSTALGEIVMQLDSRRAPLTVANFMAYVDCQLFDGTTFFRVLSTENQQNKPDKIHIIQGGLKPFDPKALPPISHEDTETTGIRHKDGTVSMARTEPGSAAGSFFVVLGDQPALDYQGGRQPDGEGFAAFGRVTEGMDVVRDIWRRAEMEEYLAQEIPINAARRRFPAAAGTDRET